MYNHNTQTLSQESDRPASAPVTMAAAVAAAAATDNHGRRGGSEGVVHTETKRSRLK